MANETGNEISNMAQQEQEERASLISPTSNTFPSNTSSSPNIESDWNELVKELIVEPQPPGSFGLENLPDRSVALNNMIMPFSANSKTFNSAPTPEKNSANDVFEQIQNQVYNEIQTKESVYGKINEAQPIEFSIKGSNLDRYYSHPKFQQLGFNIHGDNETKYNEVSSWWDENSRMRSQFFNVFSTGFLSTYQAVGDIMTGNYMTPDTEASQDYSDAFRIGTSSREGGGKFWNNLMLNSAYTVGIMSNIAVEELALAGLEAMSLGYATPVVANRTAYNIARGGKALNELFDVGAHVERSRKMLNSMKNVDFAKNFWLQSGKFTQNMFTPNTIKALKNIDSVQGTAKALSGIAKGAKTFGGVYRDFRAINLAMAESKLEGGMVKDDRIDERYAEFIEKNNRTPVGAELDRIIQEGNEAGFTTVMLNAPIIFLSNKFVFDTALRGFGTAGKLMNQQKQGILNRMIKKAVVKEGDKAFEYAGTAFEAFKKRGFSGNLKTFTGAALNYGRFNIVEGLQEVTQEAISHGTKDYYRNLYNDPMSAGLDAIWASTMSGVNAQMSGQGFEVFMSGFLMGGLVQLPQKFVFEGGPNLYKKYTNPEDYTKYEADKEEYIKETVDILNKAYENPEHYFDETKLNVLNQKQINENLFATTFSENVQDFMDEKDAGIFSALHRIIESNQMFNYREQMEDFLKLDDKGLAEAFKNATPEEIKSGKTRERINNMLDRMDHIEKSYKQLNDEIVNPFNPSDYKKGTTEFNTEFISQKAFNRAKMLALYTRDTFERSIERSNQMYSEFSTDPILKKIATNDIDALANTQNLISEIRLLKIELKNTIEPTKQQGVKLSAEEKIAYNKKKIRLNILQDYFAELTDPKNIQKFEIPNDLKKETYDTVNTFVKDKSAKTKPIAEDAIKKIRKNILSTDNITDEESEVLAIYASGSANPFGIFDPANLEKLREVVKKYLNNISEQEKDSFMDHDKLTSFLTKIIDYKSLKNRAEDYDKAINILINPSSLYSLAKRMEIGFWEIFMENKQKVEERMRAHVGQEEKNEFLKQLAKHGIYPEVEQVEVFLKGGEAPYLYMTEEDIITPENNTEIYQKKEELLAAYLNLSKNKVQEKKKKEEKEDIVEKKEENDSYNFKNTHWIQNKNPDDEGSEKQAEELWIGTNFGNKFLREKHKEYLLSRLNKADEKETLHTIEDWLDSDVSLEARKTEFYINKIYNEVYTLEKLLDKSKDSFFNWFDISSDDPRIITILKDANISVSEFKELIQPEKSTEQKKEVSEKKEVVKIEKRSVTNEEGNKMEIFEVGLNSYLTEIEALQEKGRIEEKNKKEKPFTFATKTYEYGNILTNSKSEEYIILSNITTINETKKIHLKETKKIDSKSEKDDIYLTEEEFKKMNFTQLGNTITYFNTQDKIKANEFLVVTPIWDYKEGYIQRGNDRMQGILRDLTEDDKKQITFKVTPGRNWDKQQATTIDEKKSFKEKKSNKSTNDLIKKHAQKWTVEVQLNDETIGYFQGPTSLIFLKRNGDIIDPRKFTEEEIGDFFREQDLQNETIEEKTNQIINSYNQSFSIYQTIDKLMGTTTDIGNFTQEDLNVTINISEGSLALADDGVGVLFKELSSNTLSKDIVDENDLMTVDEDPYYVIDYTRVYEGEDKGEKIERSIITNIKSGTDSSERLKEEINKYEEKFDAKNRLGRYIAVVSIGGKLTFINLRPKTMSSTEVEELLKDLQKQSKETTEEIEKNGKQEGYNIPYNENLKKKLFIASPEGVYIEMKISQDGSFRLDYSDIGKEIKPDTEGTDKDQDKATLIMKPEAFQKIEKFEDLLEQINKDVTKTKEEYKITVDNFKTSLPKDITRNDIMNMTTGLDKEVKKNFNLTLGSTESLVPIDIARPETIPFEEETTADDLSPDTKREIIIGDYKNVDLNILKNIAEKLIAKTELTEFESNIYENNQSKIQAIQINLVTTTSTIDNQGNSTEQQEALTGNEIITKINSRKKFLRDKNIQDNPKASIDELQLLNQESLDLDEELIQLNELLRIYKEGARKITDTFDGHDIEDIETFTNYIKFNLPEFISNRISKDTLESNLKTNYKTVGMFMMSMKDISRGIQGLEGVITTGRNTPFKYHEAFHAVFRMLLTEAEITKYLKLAKKEVLAKLKNEGTTLNAALDNMRKQHSRYAEMSKEQLEERFYEEYLADEFDKFKMNPRTTKTNTEIKSIFQRIIDFILEILRNFKPRKLNYLFEGIDSRKYKNASIKENRFTKTFDGDVAFKLDYLDDGRFVTRTSADGSKHTKRVMNSIPHDQTHAIISGIAATYIKRTENLVVFDEKEFMNKVIDDWIEIYNSNRQFYKDKGTEWYFTNLDHLDILYKSLSAQREDIKKQVREFIIEFYVDESNTDENKADNEEQERRSTGNFEKTSDQFGGYNSLSKSLKFVIATTTVEEEDIYGNKFLNVETEEPLIINVDGNKVYNGLIKSLSNSKTELELFQKAWLFSRNNRHTKAVVDKIFMRLGLYDFATTDQLFNEDATLPFQTLDSKLYMSFVKGFQKNKYATHLHIQDPTGIVFAVNATTKENTNFTLEQWAERYNRKQKQIQTKNTEEYKKVREDLINLGNFLGQNINKIKSIQKRAIELSNNLKESFGIDLHANYILYSLYSMINEDTLTKKQKIFIKKYKNTDPIEREDISEIYKSIGRLEHPFYNTPIEEGVSVGVKGRLTKLALNNSEFDEAAGQSSYINEDGNKVYSITDPNYQVMTLQNMTVEALKELKKDPYYQDNYLLNDPNFLAAVEKGLKPDIISGMLETELLLQENTLVAKKQNDTQKSVSYGKAPTKDFVLMIIHNYLNNYNKVSPDKTKTLNGPKGTVALAGVLIRILEAANKNDFLDFPVKAMVNKNQNTGETEISDIAINAFKNEIKIEFDRMRRYHADNKAGIDNPYENSERQAKLHMTYTLLTKLQRLTRNIKTELPILGKDQKEAIVAETQKITLVNRESGIKTNLSENESGIVQINDESFEMTNIGFKNISSYKTKQQRLELIEKLGTLITPYRVKDLQYPVTIDNVKYFVYNFDTAQFFNIDTEGRGSKDLNIFEFVKVEKIDKFDTTITETETDGESIVELKEKDFTIVERLEKIAKSGLKDENGTDISEEKLFDFAFKEIGGEDLIRERLNDEIKEFILSLKEIKAYNKISPEISETLGTYQNIKDKTSYNTSNRKNSGVYMNLYNLKQNDLDFNLAQIYLHNYIHAKSINQLLLGDQALSLKDFVNAVKRGKMQHAAGVSAETEIYDETVNVLHKVDHISGVVFDDIKDSNGKSVMDGAMYITTKTARYLKFGFNGLTKDQARALDLIEEGDIETINNEFFGNSKIGRKSWKKLDAILNSMKLVYADGKNYLKMSAIPLSKNETSYLDPYTNEWVAREGLEDKHNLRIKMEKEEARAWKEGKGTLAIAIPLSASKMMNMNVVKNNRLMMDESDINLKNITNLSAKHMRLQMINPSNKITSVTPKQIQNLITGEQDPNSEVMLNGVPTKVKDIVTMYHKATGDKALNNYFAQRNLTFSWADATKTLEKVKNMNTFMPSMSDKDIIVDLFSFAKFAFAGLEASNTKTQMKSYFQVDEFGNLKYDLNGPLTNETMEKLFFSYFTKSVAAEQPGIQATLMPDHGLPVVKRVIQVDKNGTPIEWDVIRSEDWEALKANDPEKYKVKKYTDKEQELHLGLKPGDFYLDRLRFNVMEYKNGVATGQRYSEFMMPPHFKSLLKNKIDWNKPLPEAIAKMFGIRIPSQDKHSAVNLKLVDFLPVFMGSTAAYSRELIELSGADFDIDKLYMHIKSFFYDGKTFVEYGKVKNDKEGYRHYVRYVLEQATKKDGTLRQAIERWTDKDIKKTIGHNKDVPKGNAQKQSKELLETLDEIMQEKSTVEEKVARSLYEKTEGLAEALEILGLPVTYIEYVEFKKIIGREPYQAAIDNQLLDLKFALLGNDGVTDPRKDRKEGNYFEPAETKEIEAVWEWLQKELGNTLKQLGTNERDVDSFLGMMEAWENTRGGQEAIGSVVLPNVGSSIVTEYKIKLREGQKFSIPQMNGISYDTFEFDYARNHITGKQDPNQSRKQYIISGLISQATDNAKNPLISKLNLNKKILPTLVTMLSLGVDFKSAILMINNPSIKEALFYSNNKNSNEDPGFKTLIKNRIEAIDTAISAENLDKERSIKTPEVTLEALSNSAKTLNFDRSQDYTTIKEVSDELILEKAILDQFIIFSDITETLRHVTVLVNLQKTLGQDTYDFDKYRESSEELGLTLTDEEFEKSSIPMDLRKVFVKNGTLHNTFYEIYNELYDRLTPAVLLKRTEKFTNITNTLIANINVDAKRLNKKQKNNINKDLVNYLTLKAYMVNLSKDPFKLKTLESLKNTLIYSGKLYTESNLDPNDLSIKDVLDEIKLVLKQKNKKNSFIDSFIAYIDPGNEDNNTGLMQAKANTWVEQPPSEINRLQNSVLDLLTLDDNNGTMEDNIMHLVHYLAVTKGMSFGDGSFINVIPPILLKDLLNSVSKVHQLFLDPTENSEEYMSTFGLTMNELTNEFVKGWTKSTASKFFVNKVFYATTLEETETEEVEGEEIDELDSLTVDFDMEESITNTKMLSNVAYRPFIYTLKGVQYSFGSVMHAYQVLRSGEFNEVLDKKYKKGNNSNELMNVEGKNIEGRKIDDKDPKFFIRQLVQESILQNLNLANIQTTLLPQILFSTKKFIFPQDDVISKATLEAFEEARKNIMYEAQTEDTKSRKFVSKIMLATQRKNNKIKQTYSPIIVDKTKGEIIIDLNKKIDQKYQDQTKEGIRTLLGAENDVLEKNIENRFKNATELQKKGFTIIYTSIKIGKETYAIPQVALPVNIIIDNELYSLTNVRRDNKYKESENLNDIIPSDYVMAYGNKARYVKSAFEGSSSQTRIGFMFGDRPTAEQIKEYMYNKKFVPTEEIIPEEAEGSIDDLNDLLGITPDAPLTRQDLSTQPSTSVEEGVSELFESNPELANKVYEVLGFKTNNRQVRIQVPTTLNNYSTTVDVFDEDKNKIGVVDIQNRGNGWVSLHPKLTEKGYGESLYSKISEYYTIVESAESKSGQGSKLWEKLREKRVVNDGITGSFSNEGEPIVQGVIEKGTFKLNNQITPQQKQQALQLYSEYLDTIFPDSKVKDIVYHGGKRGIDKFIKPGDKRYNKTDYYTENGIYFSDTIENAQNPYANRYGKEGTVYSILLNIKNPIPFDKLFKTEIVEDSLIIGYKNDGYIKPSEYGSIDSIDNEDLGKIKKDGYDGIAGGGEKIVFEPEQIHILGNKQDIDGFKEFVTQPSTSVEESIDTFDQLSLFDDSSFEEIETDTTNNVLNQLGEYTAEEELTDWYEGLSSEQKGKLAVNKDTKIKSAKDVVSLHQKNISATPAQLIELLNKCYT